MTHPIRGLLVGPLAAPLAFWIVSAAHARAIGSHTYEHTLYDMAFVVAITLPWSYAISWKWGALVVFGLRAAGRLRAAPVVLAGAAGGAAFGAWVMKTQSGDMFRIWLPWWAGAIVGASVAAACWLAGRGRQS
jgi:hypothetical protein